MADRRLQVFHAVAKHLSFTRAADALFMTQPAVTFQIKQLEEQYGTRLFERRHGSISLSPAGELVFSYARRILALSDEMETRLSEMTDEMRGPLLLGASTTIAEFMLPRVLGGETALNMIVSGEPVKSEMLAALLRIDSTLAGRVTSAGVSGPVTNVTETGTNGVLEIYAGDKLVRRFIKIDKLSTAMGTEDGKPVEQCFQFNVRFKLTN